MVLPFILWHKFVTETLNSTLNHPLFQTASVIGIVFILVFCHIRKSRSIVNITIVKEIMKNEIENLSHCLKTICHTSCVVLTRQCQSYFSSTFKWFSPLRRLRFVYTLVYNHKSIHSIPNNMFFVLSNSEIQVSLWKMVPLATQNIYAEG